MRKGITPIISIIVLLLITIALAGVAWTYLQGQLLVRTEKAMEVPFNGAWCDSNGEVFVTISNTGTTKILADEFVVETIGTNSAIAMSDIDVKQAAVFSDNNLGAGYGSGTKVAYRFVAGGAVVNGEVQC
jgi:flagellin-like protein